MLIKPNLIGIGGQKCASTWLSECLRSHPEVFMSSPKELRYFSDNENSGLDWYLDFFRSSGKYKYRGEFASNYIYWPESAQKIRAALGSVKIVAVVRDPADRALSHIKHLIRTDDLPRMSGHISKRDLSSIVEKCPKVLSNSCYQPGLKAYRNVFGEASVFIVSQATCLEKGELVLNALWRFLDVNPMVEIAEASQMISTGVVPRFFWLERLRKQIFQFSKYRAPWLINWIKKSGISSSYRKINQGSSLSFSKEAFEYFQALCEEDWQSTQLMLSIK